MKTRSRPRKRPRKKEKNFIFSWTVSWSIWLKIYKISDCTMFSQKRCWGYSRIMISSSWTWLALSLQDPVHVPHHLQQQGLLVDLPKQYCNMFINLLQRQGLPVNLPEQYEINHTWKKFKNRRQLTFSRYAPPLPDNLLVRT